MTIPFLDIFKKWTDRFKPVQTSIEPTPRNFTPAATKAEGERLSKTVMPNTTRSTSSDFFKEAGDSAPNVRAAGMRALPPTVALALQPKVERAISLQLSDVIGHIPGGFLKPAESFDAGQTILLKASEIEKGMSDSKPAVSLFSIYEQVPDIFVRNVRPDDATQVAVPEGKVLEQLRKMQVRDDQEVESSVPQVDTPILKVTIEDTQRFGTSLPVIKTSHHPRVKVEPASARALSNAEPEVAVSEKLAPGSRPVSASMIPAVNFTTPPKITPHPGAADPVTPARIPFKLPPKGADGPAKERVPASSSSSVPPSVPVSTSATRIPFKMTPPSDDLKPKLQIVPGGTAEETADKKTPAVAVPAVAKQISLALRPVIQNMPSFQLHRSADSVAADARVELPHALVESQLATGRIAVPIKLFRDALPADYKDLVVIDASESPVLLPLQEVLKNLSPDTLRMREDQVADEVGEGFETPFSIKAAEDAKRFTETPTDVETPAAATKPAGVGQPNEPAVKPEIKDLKVADQVSDAHSPAPKESGATNQTPSLQKAAESKPIEFPKAPELKLPAVAKAPEAKPEGTKAPEIKPIEIAKPLELKLPVAAKAPIAATNIPESTPAVVAKVPEVKPQAPEIAPQPVAKQPESAKAEPQKTVTKPATMETPMVFKLAPQAPVTTKPAVEFKPSPAPEAKATAKTEVKAEPALKPPAGMPNESKPSAISAPQKSAAKPDVNTNAKAVVEQANALPGVAGSVVIFEDGLSLAGNLPDNVQAGGLCAMAPSILQRINRHTADTKFGPLVSMTLSCRDSQLSFFMTGSVCLAALHSQPVLPGETHRQLAAKTAELSRIYSQPGEKHVDH